jgi:acetyl-CoA carboxylase carboxyltransferase component
MNPTTTLLNPELRPGREPYETNRKAMAERLARLEQALATAREGGGEKYNARHQAQGKLLPRERVERVLDGGSYFLELLPLAGFGQKNETPGAAVVAGVGLVAGRETMIVANEATVKAGALTESGVKKLSRLAEISFQNELPILYLVESAGVDLPNQANIFIPCGREFRDLTRRSKRRIPTIAVVFGSSTAGGAYIPGMSDYTILVKERARVFLAGPPLVKMATGEVVDAEELGGAAMHTFKSGMSDFLAEDELDGLRLAREILASLPERKSLPERRPVEAPRFSAEELLGIPSANPRVPYDVREIVARLVDGSRFREFKPDYGTTLVTGYAYLHGFPIGILGNNGILDSESSAKGAQFIQLCNQQSLPILFLQNITGFIVGKRYEESGIIRNGAKMINAVSNSTVPMITIMVGASYGAGNYAMCGRAYEPRFLFTWPTHQISVMGPAQLGGVMEIIKREAAKKAGKEADEAALADMRRRIEEQIAVETDYLYATGRTWDDGVIDPRDTRDVVGICLSLCYRVPVEGTMAFGVFRH